MTREPERTVPTAAGEAEICAQAFGDPADPAVLLIMGQMGSMLWWRDEFCGRLAARGRYVLRYDHRDTGRSTSYPPGEPGYSGDDLAEDPIAVLDAYGIERAHIAGVSMGGGIAQTIAVRHPGRVASLTLLSTRTIEDAPDLPPPDPAYMEHAGSFAEIDWSDADAVAEMFVADCRAAGSTLHPFDEEATRAFVDSDLARARNPASFQNHTVMDHGDGVPDGSLGRIAVPTVVLHGSSDPLFPPGHGEVLAASIPGASLELIEGGGHVLHERDWDQLIEAVVTISGKSA